MFKTRSELRKEVLGDLEPYVNKTITEINGEWHVDEILKTMQGYKTVVKVLDKEYLQKLIENGRLKLIVEAEYIGERYLKLLDPRWEQLKSNNGWEPFSVVKKGYYYVLKSDDTTEVIYVDDTIESIKEVIFSGVIMIRPIDKPPYPYFKEDHKYEII